MKISVAMATYNGAKYLSAQLDSLATQEYLPHELVICDDGSSDDTLQIVERFSEMAPFSVRIYRNPQNLGYADNFFKAARLCSGEWIAFCDQDDVWLPNKLRDANNAIKGQPNTMLVLQNAYLCNFRLDKSGRIFPSSILPGSYGAQSQFGFWSWLGCLQTFRASMIKEVSTSGLPRNYYPGHESISHDKLTCLLANALGDIVVLREPAALYRRHPSALTGDYAIQTLRQRLDKALPVGSNHYAFLAEVATETAEYLRRVAKNTEPAKASNLVASARSFDKLSRFHTARADLYSSTRVTERLAKFAHIARAGGYVGPPMVALGWKSAAKDLLCVLGLLGGRAKRVVR